jgi:hypothetical protein
MKKGSKQKPEAIEKMQKAKLGKVLSEETKEKMRISQLKPETLQKNRDAHIGRKASLETREKLRLSHLGENNSFYGKHHTPETLKKLTGRPFSVEHRENLSKVKKGKTPANIEILKSSRVGSTNSEEHRRIVSEALTGLKRSEETIELNRIAHTGLIQSDEAREKNRMAHIGERNHAWKGGITVFNEAVRSSAKYLAWRDAVYKCDNYADVITGEKGDGNLNAHHIIPFATILEQNNITTFEEAMACEALWDVDNGITMIDKNHIAYHSRTGTPE